MSSIEQARSGRGGVASTEMPPDIAEVDHLICTGPLECKTVLIVYYAQHGHLLEKANRLGLTRWSFKRRLERGESYVAINL